MAGSKDSMGVSASARVEKYDGGSLTAVYESKPGSAAKDGSTYKGEKVAGNAGTNNKTNKVRGG